MNQTHRVGRELRLPKSNRNPGKGLTPTPEVQFLRLSTKPDKMKSGPTQDKSGGTTSSTRGFSQTFSSVGVPPPVQDRVCLPVNFRLKSMSKFTVLASPRTMLRNHIYVTLHVTQKKWGKDKKIKLLIFSLIEYYVYKPLYKHKRRVESVRGGWFKERWTSLIQTIPLLKFWLK